ncbi:thiamine pyrophosphokinase [Coniothyrium glycines]
MAQPESTTILEPARFLEEDARHGKDYAGTRRPDLVILNQPITEFAAFARLWRNTGYHICADGGANRLFDMFEGELRDQRERYLPEAVHGDLDSLRADVGAYYAAQGVAVTRDKDQDSTDFGKCMQKLRGRGGGGLRHDVVVLGTLGGRVDQGLGLLHEMSREENKRGEVRLWLFSECSLSIILRSGRNRIRGLQSSGLFTEKVGVVPIYCPAIISTTGLEWDVEEWETQMGGQVSTSNHVRADEVQVETSAPVLFTVERAPLEKERRPR